MRYLMLIAVLGLAGCQTDNAFLASLDPATRDHNKCVDFGYQRGTRGYADCRLSLDQDRAAAARTSTAAGLGILAASQPRTVRLRTNCNTFGTMTTCR